MKKNAKSKNSAVVNSESECIKIKLPEVVSIDGAQEVRQSFLSALEAGKGDMEVDGARVQRLTTPGVQVLLALQKSLVASQREVTFVNFSDDMKLSLSALGLSALVVSEAQMGA